MGHWGIDSNAPFAGAALMVSTHNNEDQRTEAKRRQVQQEKGSVQMAKRCDDAPLLSKTILSKPGNAQSLRSRVLARGKAMWAGKESLQHKAEFSIRNG